MKIGTIVTAITLIGLTLTNTASAQDPTVVASAPGASVYVDTGLPEPGLDIQQPTAEAYCTLDVILYVMGMALCEDGDPEEKCDGEVVVFILTDNTCQKEGSTGCSAKVGVFLQSDGNCHGGPGQKGCDFEVSIYDPTGDADNCRGGPGSKVFRLFA